MKSLAQLGPHPDFQIRTRPIPKTKKVAGGKVKAQPSKMQKAATLKKPDSFGQPAASTQPATTIDASMEDTSMTDAPMDSRPVPVARPKAIEDIQMEGQTQTPTQAATVTVSTPDPVMSVDAIIDTSMDEAAPVSYNINTYAFFPTDAPEANPIAGWPLTNVAHPPAGFREIQYPGLPDTIYPFNRDQTAHIRAIIPHHVRQMVEAQPELAPLTLAGATNVVRGRPEPG